jgi:hypothetical protein
MDVPIGPKRRLVTVHDLPWAAHGRGETVTERARFDQLKARAKGLGWELIDASDDRPFYLLRESDNARSNSLTNWAVRLDPEYPANPLSGLDSVSHMLNQIENVQGRFF